MRLATVSVGDSGAPRLAAVSGGESEKLRLLPTRLGSLDDVVRSGPEGLAAVAAALDESEVIETRAARFLAPLRRFNRDVLCTGWNYNDHFEESLGRRQGQDPDAIPAHPTFFTKAPGAIIGPYDDIRFDPDISQQWDFEVEIALVIGKAGRSISESEAHRHIFGYCVANDISQRDVQRIHGGQWMKGKSADDSTPMGPWITTPDEIPDVADLRIQCDLNGVRMQDGSTGAIVFSFAVLIAELSRGMTLHPGDVILTGTPSGVGNARDPQVFLTDGDLLVSRATGLGELRNRVTRTGTM